MSAPDKVAIATHGYRCRGAPTKTAIATHGYRCEVAVVVPVKRGGSSMGQPLPQYPPEKLKDLMPEIIEREDEEILEVVMKAVEVADANS